MKVIVLAAGRSKRLKPLEDKNFLMFLGKPLIVHQLEQLVEVGFRECIVVGGHHNLDRLREVAKRTELAKKLKLQFVEQKNLEEGMAGAVLAAEPYLTNEPLLVISANDVVDKKAYELVLEAVRASAKKSTKIEGSTFGPSFLLAKKVDSYFPGGYLKVKKGLITDIVEKPLPGREPSDLVNVVVHYHHESTKLLEALRKTHSHLDDRYEVAMAALIKEGIPMRAVAYDGFWQAVKYPWHILDLMDHFLENVPEFKQKSASKIELAPTAVIRGKVHLAEGVRVLDHAVIIGPASIGRNSVIATNALVRGSQIGENCVIGFGSEIARSYLGSDVWTHTNYIGDSVIGNDVSFGAGCVTGNLRLDEAHIKVKIQGQKVDSGRTKFGLFTGDHVRCGINTSFMPGIKIGHHCFIGAGIVVGQDIEDHQYVTGRTELVIRENKAELSANGRQKMRKKL